MVLNNNPLVSYAINAVPHVCEVMISANRMSQYQQFGYKVIKDEITGDWASAGIYTGLLNCKTEYLISIPRDTLLAR